MKQGWLFQGEASSLASNSYHWTLLRQEPRCQGQEEGVLRLELVHQGRTVLARVDMAMSWVCSSSESTRNREESSVLARRASWPHRSIRPWVASASIPGGHTLLSALGWGCHWPRWTSSSCRSSQMMPGPLGNKSQPVGSRPRELTQGRVHSSSCGLWYSLRSFQAGQDSQSCSANSMPPPVLFPIT